MLDWGGRLEIAFSEPVDLAAAESSILLDGATSTWELDPSGYRLRTTSPLLPGPSTLSIGTGVTDRAGTTLASPLTVDLTQPVSVADPSSSATKSATVEEVLALYFELAEPERFEQSVVGNRYGFHGRKEDPATGLTYFRHRWYDPELGRFISADPLGYVDGPSEYQFAGNDPVDGRDPLGLCQACALDAIQHMEMEAAWREGMTPEQIEEVEEFGRQVNRQITSVGVGFTPIAGEVHDASQTIFGVDVITGERLSTSERVFAAGAFFVPLVGGKVVREVGGAAWDGAKRWWNTSAPRILGPFQSIADQPTRTMGASSWMIVSGCGNSPWRFQGGQRLVFAALLMAISLRRRYVPMRGR